MHSISADTAAMVEEKARVVLARSERSTLSRLLDDYSTRRLTVEDLVIGLDGLLNTEEKRTLLTELTELVDCEDRKAFDYLVYRRPRIAMARVSPPSECFLISVYAESVKGVVVAILILKH